MNPALLLMSPLASLTADSVGGCHADALVLDISMAQAPAACEDARSMARNLLLAGRALPRRPLLYVKIGGFGSGHAQADLEAAMSGHADGIVLSACESGADIQHLDVLIAVHEAEHGRTGPPVRIIAEFGATAHGVLSSSSYGNRSKRLTALMWNDAALAAKVGISGQTELYTHDITRLGRSMAVLRASEAGVAAMTCLFASHDHDLLDQGRRAKANGFSGAVITDKEVVAGLRTVFSS